MEWLNLHTSVLDSAEFVGEDPIKQATWLKLLRYCIGQENGGTLTACLDWKDRKWQQLVRVTLEEVKSDSDLWSWEGDSLTVGFYPSDKEAEVQRLRAIGRTSSPAKARAAKANGSKGGRPPNNPTGNPTETQQKTHEKPIEGKGREWNGREESGISENPRSLATCPSDIGLHQIAEKVNSCSLSWKMAPVLNPSEKAATKANLDVLEAIPAEGWDAIKAYLGAKIPEGMPKYQPRSRIKLIENTSDVLNYALQWQRQNRPATPKPKPVVVDDGPQLSVEEQLAILNSKP